MRIKPLRKNLKEFLNQHNILGKWEKSKILFEKDMRYPSLKIELLEPKWRGIYSFRLDRKYRALFFISEGEAEIFQITNHYKKNK